VSVKGQGGGKMVDGWICEKAPQTDKKGVFSFSFLFFLKKKKEHQY